MRRQPSGVAREEHRQAGLVQSEVQHGKTTERLEETHATGERGVERRDLFPVPQPKISAQM